MTGIATLPDRVRLDGGSLTVEDVVAVAREDAPVEIADAAREAVRTSRGRVEDVLDSDEAVYGITTGFGELVDERIPRSAVDELQANLVRSHAAGTGRDLEREAVRAMMLTRINALAKGYSGVRETVLDHLVTMLEECVHPVVRSRGSLGASGDLAPLAHMALVLVGEGEATVETDSGKVERLSGEDALDSAGLEPLSLRAKEGLALVNGTQLTVSLGALAVHDAERVLRSADVAGALTTEVTMGTTAACGEQIQRVRPFAGQATSARNVRLLTADSEIVESHRNCDRVQDAYSIRCLPQVHGSARDAVAHLRAGIEVELNSATDNPLVFSRDRVGDRASGAGDAGVVSGGNFHGAPLAHRLDYATAALTDLAAIVERRVNRMLDPNVQESHLPPFLTAESGRNSGLMIAQYTAAALVNECRSEGRASVDNATVSGGQEDHVSMSATAAFTVGRVVDRVRRVVAIELLCGVQAAEFVADDLDHGVGTAVAYDAIRDVVAELDGDRPLDGDIDAVATLIDIALLDDALAEGLSDPPT